MPPQIKIPADRVDEFDLVVDVALRPKGSWDDSRAWNRMRIPLEKVLTDTSEIKAAVDKAIDEIVLSNVVVLRGGA